jgi:phospholipase D1/2
VTRFTILKPGYNCWRLGRARRVSFLVDAAEYFRAFRSAAERARHLILMLGWDIDSRVPLIRDDDPGPLPNALGDFMNAIVSRSRGPHAYVLTWDFAMLYALDREWMPIYKLDMCTHRRLHFRMDSHHPPGGSHHQKVIVVDDRVAFVGGMDLTHARWDTPEHRPGDPRRREGSAVPYRPFHDVQMLVEGEVAMHLGELVRERWVRAGGRRPAPPLAFENDAWPPHVRPEIENVDVAVVRTDPGFNGRPEVREVELLYLDAIRAARRYIYVENQFFTASSIAEALIERLRDPHGPEIVLVLARRTDGWLSQQTMDVLRDKTLHRLRTADQFGRLRAYYPDVEGLGDQVINVHSKVMVIDDDFVRVGSSNLNNRSMGIDTECDLAIESAGEERVSRGIAGFRNRLLAEHLGVSTSAVADRVAQSRSLIAAIEGLRGAPHTLKPIPAPSPEEIKSWLPNPEVLDPERPIDPDKLAEELLPQEEREPAHRRMVLAISTLMVLLALAAAWRWTPMRELLSLEAMSDYLTQLRTYSASPLIAVGAFVVGGFIMVPVTLLAVATIVAFGALQGFVYAFVGSVLSAIATYAVGRHLGRDTVRRFAGPRLNRLSRRLAQRGVLAVALIRMLPVAPYTVVNLVAGASHIGLRDFVFGTMIGMAPGLAAIAFFVDRVGATVQQPGVGTVATLAAVVAILWGAIYLLRRWMLKRQTATATS